MNPELFRNNKVFSSELSFPLKLAVTTPIPAKEKYANKLYLIEDKVYVVCDPMSGPGQLFCIDIATKEILWERESDGGGISLPLCGEGGEDGRVYLSLGKSIACLNADDGREIWKIDSKEYALGTTPKNIICRKINGDSELVLCRSKETGEELWRLPGEGVHGFLNAVAVDGDYIVMQGDGIHVCREKTGEVVWDLSFEQEMEQYFPGNKRREEYCSLGPLVGDVFYLGFEEDGALVAINVETGKSLWTYDLQEKRSPHRIVYHQGNLYFNVFQVWGSDNYLTCLDAKTGRLLFKTEENFTPEGCRHYQITNNFLVTGLGNHISFFDLTKKEFVWRYKQKMKGGIAVFGSGPIRVYKDQLISHNATKKEIYWFESKK